MIGQRIVGNILGHKPKADNKSRNNEKPLQTWKKYNVELKLFKEDDEYRVAWYTDGVYSERNTYYTDDYDDAIETAKDMLRRI